MRWTAKLSVMVLSLCLLACSEGPTTDPAAQTRRVPLAERVPEDPVLAEIYGRSCKNCHGVRGSQAPLTGDPVWDIRLAKGMDTLLDNTINGYRGMPPLGMCFDCDAAQFQALIEFMVKPAGPAQ